MTESSPLLSVRAYASAFFVPSSTLEPRQKWVLGLINLASVVIFWVGLSFLVNDMVEGDKYRKPFFITYINTGCFCFYLVPYLRYESMSIRDFISRFKQSYHASRRAHVEQQHDHDELMRSYGSNDDLAVLEDTSIARVSAAPPDEISIYETVILSLKFIILWFSANLVTNTSLSYTTVASQTILLSTSSFFTLLVGYLYSIEKINQNKVLGIILSFTGVFIVTKIDTLEPPVGSPSENSSLLVLWGNLLALLGAFIYGLYTILLKFKISIPGSTKERELNTHLFFGFVGVWCLVFLWPVLVILHITGVERFELPQTREVAVPLLVNAVITFVSDFCWCKAVLLTSPLTVTVGLSMTIPLAMIGDWVLKDFDVNFWYLFGAFIVTLGFFIINNDERHDFVEE